MILLESVGWIHEMLHRHGPRAVLSLEQGLTFLFFFVKVEARMFKKCDIDYYQMLDYSFTHRFTCWTRHCHV